MYINLLNALIRKKEFAEYILEGKIFIYPTDTVYGIGCNAYLEDKVNKIKKIKQRDKNKPLSIIAPSYEWIKKNFEISKLQEEFIKKHLPGPYTIILKKKLPHFLSHVSYTEDMGIRMINDTFQDLITLANVPFITTSANISGKNPPSTIEEISEELIKKVDIVIDGGKIHGTPSTIVWEEKGKIIKRKRIK